MEEAPAFRAVLPAHLRHYRYETTEDALYGLALDLLPSSPAASRARLQARVHARARAPLARGREGADASHRGSPAVAAIQDLLVSDTRYLKELSLLAMSPPDYGYLREVATKLWSELRLRGHEFDGEGFTDHVWAVLRELFPYSPGAAWDHEWAAGLVRRAFRHVADRHVEGAHWVGLPAESEVSLAAEAEDRVRYRAAVRAWVRAALQRIGDTSGPPPAADGPHTEDLWSSTTNRLHTFTHGADDSRDLC